MIVVGEEHQQRRKDVKAGLVDMVEKYKYSSASFYCTGKSEWDFLSHYEG